MLTCEELLLIHYLLREESGDETVQVSEQFQKDLERLSTTAPPSPTLKEVIGLASDLTMLIVKSKVFPTNNGRVAVVAGCLAVTLHNYTVQADWTEIENVAVMLENTTWTRNKLVEWFERIAA